MALKKNYSKSIIVQDETKSALSPKIAKLLGSIKLPEDFDYKKVLGDAVNRKFL